MTRDSRTSSAPMPFSVGRWHADPATDTLELAGDTVKLQPRTMRLLVVLAEHAGEVLGGEELLDAVWPGVVVTGQSLYQAIGELRAVLKADAVTQEFIATVPRKGYRLVAPVARGAPQIPGAAAQKSTSFGVPPAARTIAVLPFRDLGLPAESAFLREMLLADLIRELSRQPGLMTIARGTMLSFVARGAIPRQVAEELKVRYVVDGTMAKVGHELAISCELIDAAAETVLASEAIRVDAARWPDAAPQVVGRLARAMRLELSVHSVRSSEWPSSGSPGALDLAVRAWVELYCRPQTRETNDRAWAWSAEALRLDESIGAAWNVLAYCEWRAAQYAWSDRAWDALLADAIAHAQRAISLSPSDPDAYYTFGLATYTGGETARAEASVRHCIEISASFAPAYGLLGLVRAVQGHPHETAALCQRAFALSPREPLRAVWHWSQGCAASMLGLDEEALASATAGIAANPDYPACYLIAAVAAFRLGKQDAAARYVTVLRRSAFSSVERLRKNLPPMRVEPWASAFLADLHAAGLPER